MLQALTNTDRHPVFNDELHQVFFYGCEESLTWVLHQRDDQFQDLCHIAYHHEVILSLKYQYRRNIRTSKVRSCSENREIVEVFPDITHETSALSTAMYTICTCIRRSDGISLLSPASIYLFLVVITGNMSKLN